VQVLIAIDQVACVTFRGLGYVWCGGEMPNADETISGWVGRRAIAGKHWALIAERVIDFPFSPAGHCRRAAEHDLEELDDGKYL
jgi:hypothetical protein